MFFWENLGQYLTFDLSCRGQFYKFKKKLSPANLKGPGQPLSYFWSKCDEFPSCGRSLSVPSYWEVKNEKNWKCKISIGSSKKLYWMAYFFYCIISNYRTLPVVSMFSLVFKKNQILVYFTPNIACFDHFQYGKFWFYLNYSSEQMGKNKK